MSWDQWTYVGWMGHAVHRVRHFSQPHWKRALSSTSKIRHCSAFFFFLSFKSTTLSAFREYPISFSSFTYYHLHYFEYGSWFGFKYIWTNDSCLVNTLLQSHLTYLLVSSCALFIIHSSNGCLVIIPRPIPAARNRTPGGMLWLFATSTFLTKKDDWAGKLRWSLIFKLGKNI